MLPKIIKDLKEVDDKYHDLYEKKGDEYHRKAFDDDDRPKVDEFRANNRKLHKENEELKARLEAFKDVDPEKHAKAMEALRQIEEVEDKELLKKGKIEEVVEKRLGAARADFEKQMKAKEAVLSAATTEIANLRNKLGQHLIDARVTAAVAGVGTVRKGALDDIARRARQTWVIDEKGDLVPRVNGELVFGKTGDPLKVEEWAQQLLEEAPYFFEPSGGGGAGGGKKGDSSELGIRSVPNDPVSIGKNLEEIAKGKAVVRT